jgi:hypothetical protein
MIELFNNFGNPRKFRGDDLIALFGAIKAKRRALGPP